MKSDGRKADFAGSVVNTAGSVKKIAGSAKEFAGRNTKGDNLRYQLAIAADTADSFDPKREF